MFVWNRRVPSRPLSIMRLLGSWVTKSRYQSPTLGTGHTRWNCLSDSPSSTQITIWTKEWRIGASPNKPRVERLWGRKLTTKQQHFTNNIFTDRIPNQYSWNVEHCGPETYQSLHLAISNNLPFQYGGELGYHLPSNFTISIEELSFLN